MDKNRDRLYKLSESISGIATCFLVMGCSLPCLIILVVTLFSNGK